MRTLLLLIGLTGVAVITAFGWMQTDASGAPISTYHPNGRIQASTHYADGVREGLCTQWYASGQKECEGHYVAGYREGAWTFWNEDGTSDVERSGIYREGKRVGALGAN
jgi:antitoxin component YwqK of YwqJK toxin-antitoxin module